MLVEGVYVSIGSLHAGWFGAFDHPIRHRAPVALRQVVNNAGRGKNLARGKDRKVFRIYKVEQANSARLWLVAEGSGTKGSAPAANVILFDQAVDHITNRIRAYASSAPRYLWRAAVWSARKEPDKAIADYNEAIRLAPGTPGPYQYLSWLLATCPEAKYGDGEQAVDAGDESLCPDRVGRLRLPRHVRGCQRQTATSLRR